MPTNNALDELAIREWFINANLQEALTTHAICEGILSMRQLQQPQRKRRSDAGKGRKLGKLDDAQAKLLEELKR